MHRCSSSHGNMVGPCSCGLFHTQSNSFSMLFSMPNQYHKSFDETDMYPFTTSSSPSSSSGVDCTLSLGTPSTRLSEDVDEKRIRHEKRSTASCMSNLCWDLLQPNNKTAVSYAPQSFKSNSRGNNSNGGGSGSDPLLARRCANCDTTSTPLWRNGPRGPKVLIFILFYTYADIVVFFFHSFPFFDRHGIRVAEEEQKKWLALLFLELILLFALMCFLSLFQIICSHFAMHVEFGLRRKREELRLQMPTLQLHQE